MKRPFKYFFDSIITSTIGIVTMVMSLVLVKSGAISFWTDSDKSGAIMMIVGCLLLMTPKSFEKIIANWVKGKKDDCNNTDNHLGE